MPTLLENSWIPAGGTEYDLTGMWMGVRPIQMDVLEIVSNTHFRGSRGKGNSGEDCPQVHVLKDSHSDLTSDDLLWYIRGMPEKELGILRSIRFKDRSMTIPRVLSARIQLAINNL